MAERLQLELSDMAHGGEALGRREGKVFFVSYAIPGERVLIEVTQEEERWARGRLLELLAPAPERVAPRCPHFGPEACGGCHWQHIDYPAQLRFKTAVLRDQLQRIGRLPDPSVKPALAVGKPWAYRLHARLHPAGDGGEGEAPSPAGLGYVSADGQRIVPVRECPILHPLLSGLLGDLELGLEGLAQVSLRAARQTGEQMVIFEMEEDEPIALEVDQAVSCIQLLADRTPLTLVGLPHLTERVAGRDYRISPPSFFQVNPDGAEALIRLATSYLEPGPGDRLLDLYCGVGLFALALAGQVAQVIAVEADRFAAEDARYNAAAQGAENVRVVEGTVAEAMAGPVEAAELAILDPPRGGCEPGALEALARLRPRRVVYVSCDPATLARDARILAATGYRLVEAQPVDLFPQTYHIESVSLFEREGSKPAGR
jgi:23S rRNA (uracil1939-C5)-methyltransferase